MPIYGNHLSSKTLNKIIKCSVLFGHQRVQKNITKLSLNIIICIKEP